MSVEKFRLKENEEMIECNDCWFFVDKEYYILDKCICKECEENSK